MRVYMSGRRITGARKRRSGVVVAAAVLAAACAPSGAQAGVGTGAVPTFPTSVTVGHTGLPGSIELRNGNSAPNSADVNTVCNFGDGAPCPAGDPGIALIPACGQLGLFSSCTAAGADPGVFRISDLAVGEAGTACAGMVFGVSLADPATGQMRFTPQNAAHVTLAGAGAVCRIGFTFDVVRAPSVDQNAALPGIQTVQLVDNTQFAGVLTASSRGSSSGTTVEKANPTIATTASPATRVGGRLTDRAVVGGRVNPAGGTVDFRLYGPGDADCARPPVFESLGVPLGADGTAVSAPYTPTRPGTYRWRAFYSGDANNNPVAGACNDAHEKVRVSAPPDLVTVEGFPTRGRCTRTNFDLRVDAAVAGFKRARVTLDGTTIARRKQPRFTLEVRARAVDFGRHVLRIVVTGRRGKVARTVAFKRCGRPELPRFVGDHTG